MIKHIPNNLHKSNLRYNTTLGYILQIVFAFLGFYYAYLAYFCKEESLMTLNTKLTLVYVLARHPVIHENAINLCT
jgi:hypothetical protein